MASMAVHVVEYNVLSRVDGNTIILVVHGCRRDTQTIGGRHIEGIGVMPKLKTGRIQLVTSRVVEDQVADGEIFATVNGEQVRGPVLDGELLECCALQIRKLEEVVWLLRSAVATLAIPVLRTLAVDDSTCQTSNLGVGALEHDWCVVGVGGVLNGHSTSKEESTAAGDSDGEGLRGRDSDAVKQDVGAGRSRGGDLRKLSDSASRSTNTRSTRKRRQSSSTGSRSGGSNSVEASCRDRRGGRGGGAGVSVASPGRLQRLRATGACSER